MRSLVLLSLLAGPAFAKDLAPVGDIQLESSGRTHYTSYCASKNLLAASIDGKGGALYRLDVAKRSATKIGALPDAHEFAFNADCSSLALGVTSGSDKTQSNEVHVYTTADAKPRVTFGKLPYPVAAVQFVDDNTLALGINKGPLMLWSLAGTPTQLDKRDLPGKVMSLAFTNGTLAVGTYEGGIYMMPVANGKLGAMTTLAGNAPDTRETGSINTETGAIVMPGGGRVFEVRFVDGGKRLLATQEKGSVIAWPIEDGKAGASVIVADKLDGTNALAVSTDDKLFATGDNFRVAVWKSAGNKLVTNLGKLDRVENYASFRGIAFVGPKELIVGSSKTATVRLYRVK